MLGTIAMARAPIAFVSGNFGRDRSRLVGAVFPPILFLERKHVPH